jgi:hypothetical protein
MEPQGLLQYSQKHTTGPVMRQMNPIHILFL